jgi:hypothetical protein
MAYTVQSDGLYHIPVVDLGKRLRDNFGLTIREHEYFDPVDDVHAPNSYHNYGYAIDVQDWRPDVINGVDWKTRTKNLEALLQGSGAEVFGPSSGVPGHETHLHLAADGGIFKLNEDQYQYLFGGGAGGHNATFPGTIIASNTSGSVLPTSSSSNQSASATDGSINRNVSDAKERAQNYTEMSKNELDSLYDKMRNEDPALARVEGMKMHKAFFGK